MGIWVIFHRSGLYRILITCFLLCCINGEPNYVQKLEAFFQSSGSYVKTFKDVFGSNHAKRAPLINSFISASLERASRDTLYRQSHESTADIYSLNIEADGTRDSSNIKDVHTIQAEYNEQGNRTIGNENHFQPKWRERVYLKKSKRILTTPKPKIDIRYNNDNSQISDQKKLQILNNVTDFYEKNDSLLANFLKPTEKAMDSFIQSFDVNFKNNSTDENTITIDPLAENRETPTSKPVIQNNTSKSAITPSNSIFSFFAEENKKPVNEIEEFNTMEDSDDDFDSDSHLLTHHSIPILSGLIHGTLNDGMESKSEKFNEFVDSLKNFNYTGNSTKESTDNVSQSTKIDLEDPDSLDQLNGNSKKKQASSSVPKLMENLIEVTFPSHHENLRQQPNIANISKKIHKKPRPKINENKIEFIRLSQENSTNYGSCMDGTPPGYYFRKSIDYNFDKWIIHLHGGAWCYDLKSCMKRRSSILGSTKFSVLEDINSFFHGILSKNSNVNPNFYDWNVAVLSYCDGGLFSGNRKRPLTGKGKTFFFQGRSILKALLQKIRNSITNGVSEIILSGTSAGGLAVVLQGDFIRKFFPANVKIRGLVDAGVFLDQTSLLGDSIARQQFRALYSLHKPVLNKECLASVPKREKYTCLFPEKAMPYMNLSVFIVNSLYDHWQLSYLEGINCVFDNKKCDTNQHDRILQFRNHMFTALKNISSVKNDTGIFANSCFAHGQVIIDYTWTKININSKSIAQSFYNWYTDANVDKNQKRHFLVDCKYPCNGSCAKLLAEKCVTNFKAASERRRKRDAELC